MTVSHDRGTTRILSAALNESPIRYSMRFLLTCLLSLLQLLLAQEKTDEYPHQSQMMKAVQDMYVKMNLTVMLDVNNDVTVVDINGRNSTHLQEPSGSNINILYNDFIRYYFYTRKNREDPAKYIISNITSLLENKLFNVSEKTVVLVHGYLNNLTSPMIQLPLKALLDHHDVNVIAVDWYQVMARRENVYVWCAEDTLPVGKSVGQAVSELISGGVRRDSLHLVGHSLGAHVVGVAGHYLNERNQTIARITGLDPAKIEFEDTPMNQIINAGDAEFVDCIHSCGSYLGFDRPLCQTDFYPNGGFLQPGCSFLGDICCVCSHGRSYRYFAESIIPKHTFPAGKCTWTSDGLFGCFDSPQMMGYPAKSQYKGAYYVKTESEYPFSPNVKRPMEVGFWGELQVWLLSFQFIITDFFS